MQQTHRTWIENIRRRTTGCAADVDRIDVERVARTEVETAEGGVRWVYCTADLEGFGRDRVRIGKLEHAPVV